jgi:hypothetical protein
MWEAVLFDRTHDHDGARPGSWRGARPIYRKLWDMAVHPRDYAGYDGKTLRGKKDQVTEDYGQGL